MGVLISETLGMTTSAGRILVTPASYAGGNGANRMVSPLRAARLTNPRPPAADLPSRFPLGYGFSADFPPGDVVIYFPIGRDWHRR